MPATLALLPECRLAIADSTIIQGDAHAVLRRLSSASVQCIITSPPYWGMRDYDEEGQIGLAESLPQYINRLVEVFSECKRVLRDDGAMWVNIGDTFTSGNRGWRAIDKKNPARAMSMRPATPDGLKAKDLVGLPWRIAFALQDDGWYLRSDVIWNKPNAMPESVRDRPNRSHEYMFMFTKSEKYYYDRDAVRELNGRNLRSVWNVHTKAFPEAHFATFPPALIEPCVRSCSRKGDFILDPFFGSGTSGIVADLNHRRYIGIEINKEYVALAARRLAAPDERVVSIAA